MPFPPSFRPVLLSIERRDLEVTHQIVAQLNEVGTHCVRSVRLLAPSVEDFQENRFPGFNDGAVSGPQIVDNVATAIGVVEPVAELLVLAPRNEDLRARRPYPFRRAFHTDDSDTLQRLMQGHRLRACEMMARFLRFTSYDAYGPRAGAIIAVLGGRCARRLHA
jgi:hypothetical protein